MTKPIPESHIDLFDKKLFAHFATLMPDGSPHVSPVWVALEDGKIVINSAEGRLKDENVKRDARVGVSVTDPDNPYRSLVIRGKVVEITKDGAEEHIDALAQKYLGVETYPYRTETEVRIIYRIDPERISVTG